MQLLIPNLYASEMYANVRPLLFSTYTRYFGKNSSDEFPILRIKNMSANSSIRPGLKKISRSSRVLPTSLRSSLVSHNISDLRTSNREADSNLPDC